jgi:hypothetical protein
MVENEQVVDSKREFASPEEACIKHMTCQDPDDCWYITDVFFKLALTLALLDKHEEVGQYCRPAVDLFRLIQWEHSSQVRVFLFGLQVCIKRSEPGSQLLEWARLESERWLEADDKISKWFKQRTESHSQANR